MDDKELCPRLIDYLVIVGRRHPTRGASISDVGSTQSTSSSTTTTVTNPELLRRYPINDHKDFLLPTDVTVFCQPEGCITIVAPRRIPSFRETTSFVFQLTEKDSAKIRYGICLNFYRSFEKHGDTTTSKPIQSTTLVNSNRQKKLKKNNRQSYTLTSICLISHHPFLSIFREVLTLMRRLVDCCNERVCGKTPSTSKFGRDAVWSVLTGQWSDNIPAVIMHEIREMETWILTLLSAPVPLPGKSRVELQMLPIEFGQSFEFALPDYTRFSLVDFPLHLPLELLGIDTVLRVLTCVMLEYKVVLQSRNYNAVSMCVLALVSLLYPLEYMFPVIPLLPAYMNSAEQILLAPTPFIIGVPASFMQQRKISNMPNDIILVDLDSNRLFIPDGMHIPMLPEPDATNLQMQFRQALSKMSQSAGTNGQTNNSNNGDIIDSDCVDVATRVAMIKFFNSPNMFANFSEHTRTLRLYPRPVVALQVDSFLKSRPQLTEFMNDLCRTQAIEYFAECSLCPRNETYLRVQTGIEHPVQIGDKAKWFAHNLQPIVFQVYPTNSTLAQAWQMANAGRSASLTDEEAASDSDDANSSEHGSMSSVDDLVFESPDGDFDPLADFGGSKPLSEVNDVYREPLSLEMPQSESALSIGSSGSSGRSSPASSISTSAMDSEADFARLAENLALKSDAKGDFSFDRSTTVPDADSTTQTPVQNRRLQRSGFTQSSGSSSSTPTAKTPPIKTGFKNFSHLNDSSEKVLGPAGTQIMSALNGYAERSQDMLSQVLSKTAPKAQMFKDRTIRPLTMTTRKNLVDDNMLIKHHNDQQQRAAAKSAAGDIAAASQQNKNQQIVRDICDQVLSGQGVGVFTFPKLKRLMEDESLRELVCGKLNLGLDRKHASEDEEIEDIQIDRAVYKGYVKVLSACMQGIEHSFNTPGCNGFASVFHVLEIAHTHYWSKEVEYPSSPSSGLSSLIATPSHSMHDLGGAHSPVPPHRAGTTEKTTATTIANNDSTPVSTANKPARPPPPRQESIRERSKLAGKSSSLEIDTTNIVGESAVRIMPPKMDSECSERSDCSTIRSQGSSSGGSTELPPPSPIPPQSLHVREPLSTHPVSTNNSPPEPIRYYLYQDLIPQNQQSTTSLWHKMVFWENAFFDAVAQERDIIGMDQEPSEMMDRYSSLSDVERKRLELDEDRLLSTLLHNLTAFMVMCGTNHRAIQQKIRRMLGKAHIGLIFSKTINQLLDHLPTVQGNGIALKPRGSRLMQKQSFPVHVGSDSLGPMLFMEVCDDAIILRAVNGAITERWWYERLVNMTYSPKTRVLCLWRRHEDQVHMHKFYTKKCRDLYAAVKSAMERAAARGRVAVAGRDLGGEFPVHDTETNQGGLLQVRIDGVALLFANRQHFIELSNIKKCNTYNGNVFVLEEYDRKRNQLVQRKYMSQMADQICYAVLCVFSYVAAAAQQQQQQQQNKNQ